jgi:hypothetical protein
MLTKIINKNLLNNLIIKNNAFFAQDWSHIYDGIYRFEDNTLGE